MFQDNGNKSGNIRQNANQSKLVANHFDLKIIVNYTIYTCPPVKTLKLIDKHNIL